MTNFTCRMNSYVRCLQSTRHLLGLQCDLDDGLRAQQVNVDKFQCDILYSTCLLDSHL